MSSLYDKEKIPASSGSAELVTAAEMVGLSITLASAAGAI
jgi:hypothetical protein